MVHQFVFYYKYRIYHKEALKCQWKLDVSKSIILYLLKKNSLWGPLERDKTGNMAKGLLGSKLPPPAVFPDFPSELRSGEPPAGAINSCYSRWRRFCDVHQHSEVILFPSVSDHSSDTGADIFYKSFCLWGK